MNNLDQERDLLTRLMSMLEAHFGSDLEIVLHDNTLDYEHTIVDIRNSHITNRTIGGSGDNLGLEVLRGTRKDGDKFNYVNYTEDNKILRSSTLFIRDDDNQIIGSICINQDITKMVELKDYLERQTNYNVENHDVVTSDVQSMLDNLIKDAFVQVGKHVSVMTKNDKIEFVKYLDEKGAFLITKSGNKVCEVLKISKYTLYNYLDQVRDQND